MHIALYQPQIAPNTGSIIRPLRQHRLYPAPHPPARFHLDDRRLRRAGLDYAEFASIAHHDDWTAFAETIAGRQIWALTTKGERSLFDAKIGDDDVLLFGNETSGLPPFVHATLAPTQKIRLPMQTTSRSINLANAVAVVLYEAIRQNLRDKTAIFL